MADLLNILKSGRVAGPPLFSLLMVALAIRGPPENVKTFFYSCQNVTGIFIVIMLEL